MERNIEYYNRNADAFFESTVHADMSKQLNRFASYLPERGTVLDAGCGSGRDSLALLQKGFQVEAFDASEEMCKRASELTGLEVKLGRFEDLFEVDRYDGIWCCASLLHVGVKDLPDVIKRIFIALKPSGILYASFKKGEGEKDRGERHFTDANADFLRELLEPHFEILWLDDSSDVRAGRNNETWINVIGRRK